MRDTERDRNTGRGRSSKREVLCEEPDAGLDPRTLGSHPEPKADTQPLSHLGAPKRIISVQKCMTNQEYDSKIF